MKDYYLVLTFLAHSPFILKNKQLPLLFLKVVNNGFLHSLLHNEVYLYCHQIPFALLDIRDVNVVLQN
jgi:hypothetical protein